MLEAAAVVILLGIVVFVAVMFVMSRHEPQQREPVGSGRWRAAHYDVDGSTRIVVQKLSATGANLLDEHVVAELPRDAPDFDDRFLEAMATARQRQSLFEAEEG